MSLKFDLEGNLEPGEHLLTWAQFCRIFGGSQSRDRLLKGLSSAAQSIKRAGSRWLWVGGSFVTRKEQIYGMPPNDFEGCWDIAGVDPLLLDPVLLDFDNGRLRQKLKFGGELLPASRTESRSDNVFLQFFQTNKNTGKAKGIVVIDLRSLS